LRRFDETAEFLRCSLPLLAPGGMALVTVEIGETRPQAGLSRVLTPLGLERLIAGLEAAIVGWQGDVDFPRSLFLIFRKSPAGQHFAQAAGRFIETLHWQQTVAARKHSGPLRLWRWLRPWRARSGQPAAEHPREATSFSLHLPSAADWKEALFHQPPAAGNSAR